MCPAACDVLPPSHPHLCQLPEASEGNGGTCLHAIGTLSFLARLASLWPPSYSFNKPSCLPNKIGFFWQWCLRHNNLKHPVEKKCTFWDILGKWGSRRRKIQREQNRYYYLHLIQGQNLFSPVNLPFFFPDCTCWIWIAFSWTPFQFSANLVGYFVSSCSFKKQTEVWPSEFGKLRHVGSIQKKIKGKTDSLLQALLRSAFPWGPFPFYDIVHFTKRSILKNT